MDEPYIGTIIMFAGSFAPRGWALCDGQLMAIASNQALFSILGTTYGGDGKSTFALPDLRGRAPMHPGQGPGLRPRRLGEKAGAESVTLTVNELPSHSHKLQVTTGKADETHPEGNYLAVTDANSYTNTAPTGVAGTQAVGEVGANQAVSVVQPFECVNFIIALYGIYPPRS